MAKVTFNTVINDNELDKFLSMTEHHSGVRLPLAYAKNAKVVGAYVNGHLAGGYMLVTRPEFRTLMFVPDRCKRWNPFVENSPYDMLEVNALWVGPAIKTPRMQLRFWTALVFDIFFARKHYLLLMSNAKNRTIQYIHQMTNPTIIYEGAPQLPSGYSSHAEIRVAYTTRWSIMLNFPRYLSEIHSRNMRIRAARQAKRQQASQGASAKPGGALTHA